MVHEMRADWAMLLGSIILILGGAGAWSPDVWRTRTKQAPRKPRLTFQGGADRHHSRTNLNPHARRFHSQTTYA